MAGSFTDTYAQGKGETQTVDQEPCRSGSQVDLVKIDGEWLVDDFTPGERTDEQPPADEGSTP